LPRHREVSTTQWPLEVREGAIPEAALMAGQRIGYERSGRSQIGEPPMPANGSLQAAPEQLQMLITCTHQGTVVSAQRIERPKHLQRLVEIRRQHGRPARALLREEAFQSDA
jgi:hypothetical protein